MTLAQANADHLRLFLAFSAFKSAVEAAMPSVRGHGRLQLRAAMVKAEGAIRCTRPIVATPTAGTTP